MKRWGEIKGEMLRLGGEDMTAYTRLPERFCEAVNRAAVLLCRTLPLIKGVRLSVVGGEVLDGSDCDDFGGWVDIYTADRTARPAYHTLPDGSIVVGEDGEWYAFYRVAPPCITLSDSDEKELMLSEEAGIVLPILASFYVWEDEDERKAVRLRSDAYELLAQFQTFRPKSVGVVRAGEDI